eukprot:TRINITY_DN0_c136_g1_i1.p1 TRINITY_DN0_c136_g1~~TRINITY_DN0_c136_g1_i1.p1  ORF type:complete len:135 (-),score=47.30 TRINITY_DN0_c136_g1_i1:99-503(-)
MCIRDRFFTVCLYTCYELVKPDVALELSWRFGLLEHAMPFFIQIMRELTTRVDTVQKKHEDREKKEEKQAKQQLDQPLGFVGDMLLPGMNPQLMLMGPPGMPGGNMGGPNPMMPGGFPPMGGLGGFGSMNTGPF